MKSVAMSKNAAVCHDLYTSFVVVLKCFEAAYTRHSGPTGRSYD